MKKLLHQILQWKGGATVQEAMRMLSWIWIKLSMTHLLRTTEGKTGIKGDDLFIY